MENIYANKNNQSVFSTFNKDVLIAGVYNWSQNGVRIKGDWEKRMKQHKKAGSKSLFMRSEWVRKSAKEQGSTSCLRRINRVKKKKSEWLFIDSWGIIYFLPAASIFIYAKFMHLCEYFPTKQPFSYKRLFSSFLLFSSSCCLFCSAVNLLYYVLCCRLQWSINSLNNISNLCKMLLILKHLQKYKGKNNQ